MGEFDWVTARSECSEIAVFEAMKAGAERDAKMRHNLPETKSGYRFVADRDSFSVVLEGPLGKHIVRFRIENKSITASLDDRPFLKGTVTLSDDGICRLSVEGQDLEFWQFRKRALEHLFFGF